jgi:hypothetical protein
MISMIDGGYLENAAIKLQRAVASPEAFDPISGYTAQEIAEYIAENIPLGNKQAEAAARATLRKYGFEELAEEI